MCLQVLLDCSTFILPDYAKVQKKKNGTANVSIHVSDYFASLLNCFIGSCPAHLTLLLSNNLRHSLSDVQLFCISYPSM